MIPGVLHGIGTMPANWKDFRIASEVLGELHFGMENLSEEPTFRWKWLALVPLLFLAGWLGYRWVFPAYVPPVQPVPNGYDELVELGGKVARRTGFWPEMSEEELASIVAVNQPILDDARKSLRKECVVSLDWSADRKWFDDVHMKRTGGLRELARAFAAEGRHALLQGDSRHAVTCGLEALQLVPAASYGGLGIDYLMGLAVSYGSVQFLRDACDIATLDDCKYVLNNLPDVRKQMETPEGLSLRERHFMRQINGAYFTFVTDQMFSANRAEFEERLKESLNLAQARTGLLRLHYALRAFKLAENRLPKELSEMVGRELKEVPQDPFRSEGFVYQAAGERFILYSVGPNGLDDGGVGDPKSDRTMDLLLEPRESLGTVTVPAND